MIFQKLVPIALIVNVVTRLFICDTANDVHFAYAWYDYILFYET